MIFPQKLANLDRKAVINPSSDFLKLLKQLKLSIELTAAYEGEVKNRQEQEAAYNISYRM